MKKTFVIGFIIMLSAIFIYSKPIFNTKLRASALIGGIASFSSDQLYERISSLERENDFLKEQLESNGEEVADSIKVYSSYPFNSRSEIVIAEGKDSGVKVGDTVLYGGNALVGHIMRVFDSSSVVKTILDPTEEIAVRIGEDEVDALLQGGNEITLTLIPHDEEVNVGDRVITAGRGFPYGLEVGTIRSLKEGDGEAFKEAILTPSFSIKNLRDVTLFR